MSSKVSRRQKYNERSRQPSLKMNRTTMTTSDAPPQQDARTTHQQRGNNQESSTAPQDTLPQHYFHSRMILRTGLPDSEPIYHDIEEERQRFQTLKRQRPPRHTSAVENVAPARQRVVSFAASGNNPAAVNTIKPFRPLPELHLPQEETEPDRFLQRVPSDIKDTWVMYSDAFESGSVLTGLSRQELLQRRANQNSEEVKKRKEKKYGKKKKKSLILNLPIGFIRRSEDWPKYCRGADELSSTAASAVFRSGKRRAQLSDRLARKGSRRFLSSSFREAQSDNIQHDMIPPITSRCSEDLTSAMSSQSPNHQTVDDHNASMDDYVDGSQINDQLVQEWLALDSREQYVDRSIMSDDASFPYLSAPSPRPRPALSRPSPSHNDSSITQSSAAASDQAVADSTATLDDLRGEALEKRVNLDVYLDTAANEYSEYMAGIVGDLGNEEDHVTLETVATIGNDSPTSIVDLQPVKHSSRNRSQPNQSQDPSPPAQHVKSAPKSILRRKGQRSYLTDCPSDEGRIDENGHHLPRKKTVRIAFEGEEDQVAKSPPRDGGFRDDDGVELSPIRPDADPQSLAATSSKPASNIVQPTQPEVGIMLSTPMDQGYEGRWQADGWRESDPTRLDLDKVCEVDEVSEIESDNYSCGFIEEVAAVVIQTAVRQFLAKELVLKMLEKSIAASERENYFNDMTFRMYTLAAIKIQSAFRGWWVRDSLSVDHYCAKLIQRIFRGFLHRTNYHFDLYRVIVVQSIWRRNAARVQAVDRLSFVISIQAAYRGYRVRKNLDDAWEQAQTEVWAATKIQARWRGYDAQMNYLHTLADILVVQSIARLWITKRFIVPFLQLQKLGENTGSIEERRKRAAQMSNTSTYQNKLNTTRSGQSFNSRTLTSSDAGGQRQESEHHNRQRYQKWKTNDEVESRSDGESGASEIIQALRATEEQNLRAWKQQSAASNKQKKGGQQDLVSVGRHPQRERHSNQHR